ncbi:NAD(P)H-binding protein [Planomonospora sp. ID82291]|uniref:NmrA family NAD(P)-binding protein n=1 Tax=Planomonospora sp. ID82291 TaxID=2738136 RepID=UPI0018C3EB15|nr:NAD(P)H-binding protein [Planomonospora sp. ID82291]MBG0813559.1 NAD(P)H-binding protein [Planomonospora sp. ID82291]
MILVTGASGALGRLVIGHLAGRLTGHAVTRASAPPAGEGGVVVGTRNPERVPAGAPVRRIDFDDPPSLADGFDGVETLLLVSAGYGEDDAVIARHGAAIDAAEKAGVGHIVYTSLSAAGDHLPYALAHRWTERRLRSGTAGWTILRNGLYAELLAALTPVEDGAITAPLADGRLAAVAREDLAEAAALVAADAAAHAGRTYELVGEQAIGGADLARARAADTGAAVSYEPGTLAQAREAFTASGLAPFQIPMLVGTYSAIAGGFLSGTGGELRDLLGRTPRSALEIAASRPD